MKDLRSHCKGDECFEIMRYNLETFGFCPMCFPKMADPALSSMVTKWRLSGAAFSPTGPRVYVQTDNYIYVGNTLAQAMQARKSYYDYHPVAGIAQDRSPIKRIYGDAL